MEYDGRKSWFGRNWVWVIPVGGCMTIMVLGVIFVGTLFFGVANMLKNSTPYEYALEQATNHQDVISALGHPIESDGMISGNISYKNESGNADFSIPIKGSKGTGKIFIVAEKINGEWIYDSLYVIVNASDQRIDLLGKTLHDI